MKTLFTLPVIPTDPNSESDTVNDTTIETSSKRGILPISLSVLVDMKDYVHVRVKTGWYEQCAWESVGVNKNNVRID